MTRVNASVNTYLSKAENKNNENQMTFVTSNNFDNFSEGYFSKQISDLDKLYKKDFADLDAGNEIEASRAARKLSELIDSAKQVKEMLEWTVVDEDGISFYAIREDLDQYGENLKSLVNDFEEFKENEGLKNKLNQFNILMDKLPKEKEREKVDFKTLSEEEGMNKSNKTEKVKTTQKSLVKIL